MKEGWEYKKIKDIGSVIAGTTPNTNVAEYWDGNLCWISPAELDGNHYLYDSRKKITEAAVKAKSLKLLPEGTVILSSRAPIGKVVINKVPTYCNQGFKCVVCGKEIYNEFLYWWFWGKTEYLNSLGTGATFKEISKKVVEEILIPVPPLSEQQSIVDYLDAAFAKIDAMKANAEKALNEAKALFQASLREMLEPKEGWEEKMLKEICRVINGRAYSKDEMLKQGKYRLLRVGNFFTNDSWYYSDLELEEDKYCDKGDLLYAWSASFGPRIWDGEKVIYHYHIWKMVCSKDIDKYFLCYWLDSDELKQQTMSNLHGATMAHITKGIIEAAHVSYPSLSEQQSIVETLDSLKSKVDRLQANSDKISQECDALKQAILKQVFE
ncbi:MAG: restriction endonuclease subunit S [Prevotella sp.]|jgi:type I restriction enzyme S subunit|nr:restriction endonuclease subunit S [Prevotella sp.]